MKNKQCNIWKRVKKKGVFMAFGVFKAHRPYGWPHNISTRLLGAFFFLLRVFEWYYNVYGEFFGFMMWCY